MTAPEIRPLGYYFIRPLYEDMHRPGPVVAAKWEDDGRWHYADGMTDRDWNVEVVRPFDAEGKPLVVEEAGSVSKEAWGSL